MTKFPKIAGLTPLLFNQLIIRGAVCFLCLSTSAAIFAQEFRDEPGPLVGRYDANDSGSNSLGLRSFRVVEPLGQPDDYFDIYSQKEHLRVSGSLTFSDGVVVEFGNGTMSRCRDGRWCLLTFTAKLSGGKTYYFRGTWLERPRHNKNGDFTDMDLTIEKKSRKKRNVVYRLPFAHFAIL
jgi:hypothetical protein